MPEPIDMDRAVKLAEQLAHAFLHLKAEVDQAPHDLIMCDSIRCQTCKEQANICELQHEECSRFSAYPCNCWKSTIRPASVSLPEL